MPKACDLLYLESIPCTVVRKNDNGCSAVLWLDDAEEGLSVDMLLLSALLRGLFDGEQPSSSESLMTRLSPTV